MKKRALILCTGNSARSQMGEALLRALTDGRVEVHSAGTHPTAIRDEAVAAMREIGLDISGQRSKQVSEFEGDAFDYVITVCDRARESCPVFPAGTTHAHWSFDDPSACAGSAEEGMQVYRRVRDQIRQSFRDFVEREAL